MKAAINLRVQPQLAQFYSVFISVLCSGEVFQSAFQVCINAFTRTSVFEGYFLLST